MNKIHCPKCDGPTVAAILYPDRFRCWAEACNVTWISLAITVETAPEEQEAKRCTTR